MRITFYINYFSSLQIIHGYKCVFLVFFNNGSFEGAEDLSKVDCYMKNWSNAVDFADKRVYYNKSMVKANKNWNKNT